MPMLMPKIPEKLNRFFPESVRVTTTRLIAYPTRLQKLNSGPRRK